MINCHRNRVFAAFFIFLVTPYAADAQDKEFKFYSLTVSSGQNAISSGITGVAQFAKGARLIEVGVQHDQARFIYGTKFSANSSLKGFVGATAGHFRGSPWAGPLLTLGVPVMKVAGQQVTVGTMQWPEFFPWKPDGWNIGQSKHKYLLLAYLGGANLNIGPVGLDYSLLKFLDDPWNELPGVSYTKKIQKDFSVSGSATWNNNDKHWMFYLGLTWKPTS